MTKIDAIVTEIDHAITQLELQEGQRSTRSLLFEAFDLGMQYGKRLCREVTLTSPNDLLAELDHAISQVETTKIDFPPTHWIYHQSHWQKVATCHLCQPRP